MTSDGAPRVFVHDRGHPVGRSAALPLGEGEKSRFLRGGGGAGSRIGRGVGHHVETLGVSGKFAIGPPIEVTLKVLKLVIVQSAGIGAASVIG